MREQPLRGRDAELAQLGQLAGAARADREVHVALVDGEAGMGKSSLVEAFARQIGAGDPPATVLLGECLDLGSATLPYAPVVQALRPVLRDPAAVGLHLDEPTRAGLARLIPELGEAAPAAAGMGGLEVGHTQLFEQVLAVLERLADASGLLVLVIEDVHFGEQSTRDLLAFLVGNLRGAPVLLVLTVRADEVGRRHPARPFLLSLERSPRVTPLHLGPLDRVAMSELVWSVHQHPCAQDDVDVILDRAGGNPFHAVELARAPDRLPEHLSDLLLDSVERCSPTAQEVLRALAAAGEAAGHDLLLQITGLSSENLTAALREAIAARLVVVTPDGAHRLRHALLQEAVEETLLPGEARALHRALAEVLSADGGPGGCHAARLARHHLAARQPELALQAAYAAGVQALEVVAYPEARAHFEQVAELWPEVPDAAARTGVDLAEVLTKAALCAISAYDDRRGIGLAEQALAHLDAEAEPARTGIVWMWIGHGLRRDWPAAEAALRRAVATVPAGDTPERARVEAALATALLLHQRLDEAETAARHALEVARRAGSARDEVYVLITLAAIDAAFGADCADEQFARARALADRLGRIDYRLRCDIEQVGAHLASGRYAEAVQLALDGLDVARTHALDRTYGTVLRVGHVLALLARGRLHEARQIAVGNAYAAPDGLLGGDALAVLAEVHLRLGDVEQAADTVRRAARHLTDVGQPYLQLELARVQAEVALAGGDAAGAHATAAAAAARACALPGRAIHPAPLAVVAAEALRAGGAVADDPAAAAAQLGQQVQAAAARGETAPHRAWRLLLEALIADVEAASASGDAGPPGDDPAAAEHRAACWGRAARAFADLGTPLPRARCLLGQAEALLVAGQRAAARLAWEEGRDVAASAGAGRLHHQADALGRRAGFAGDRPAADAHGLTSREHEVLHLVAEGLSNAEIGERLFISAKTASVHVSNILAKLDVPTRQHAAALAHREGLVG